MSDEEMPHTGMEDEDMSDDGMDDYMPPAELPDGIQKEILKEAPSDNWKKPKTGDEVTVHYVGTLQSDGSEFDSSRGRGDPFVFTLGKGQVIKGWDLGVATMKKGELAKFTLAPEFAYGEHGSPPKIPASATLVFEVELLSWASKDDLFGDEGVIKTQAKEGSGWKTPKLGDEVVVTVKADKPDGTSILAEKADFEYTLGSDALGAFGKACDKALSGMKKGEEVVLKCSKEYSGSDEGANVSLTFKELYETKDVSFMKDKTIMKKQVKEGEGYDTPKDGSSVTLLVDGDLAALAVKEKELKFVAGNGDAPDALEAAVAEMKKGEKAILTVKTGDKQAVVTVELSDFEKGKDTWSMSEEEKLEFSKGRKEVATNLFKAQRFAMALGRYKKIVDMFNYLDNFKEDNKAAAKELKKVCELNKAACLLKLGDDSEAKKSCNAVLKEDSQNVKALFRRAQADCNLKNYLECVADCKRILEIDAKNTDARNLAKKAQAGQKEVDKKSKGLFANMCKALGKGPIPPPGKSATPEYDDEDDEDDEMADGEDKGDDGKTAASEKAE